LGLQPAGERDEKRSMLTEAEALVERREIARRISGTRLEVGRSRADLARASGMDPRRLEALESGRAAPSEVELRALAAACDVHYGEFIPPGYHLTLAIGAVLAAGRATSDRDRDALIRKYVATVMELRRSPVKLTSIRREDIEELARVLGTTPEDVTERLARLTPDVA
jgi:transcriptional regulator with XRE-family HTH domain